jgi:ABC-type transport system involved in Fe-S cluster assembly fused permease/ATPase subunit
VELLASGQRLSLARTLLKDPPILVLADRIVEMKLAGSNHFS